MERRGAKRVNGKKSGSDGIGDSMVIKNLSSFGSEELDSYGDTFRTQTFVGRRIQQFTWNQVSSWNG